MAARNAKIRRAPTRRLVWTVFLCWGLLAVFLPTVSGSMAEQHEAASWPSTTGTVSRSHTTWRRLFSRRLHFTYEYEVGGRRYSSSTRRIAELSGYYLFESKQSFAAAHPVGSTIQVWYDPADPKRAAIGVGLSAFDVVPALVFLVGIALCALDGTAELWRRVRGGTPAPEAAEPEGRSRAH